ncbi:phosphoenolpyruvate carboxykinase (GTP) [Thermococcus sp. GR7]|uniref:phosphoenolpyruvate carboxykinase (GTP) n=1 Tax=unclassified Thermococcus TaxID=2627626 RepID=UPI0014302912|nr:MULTISPECIES: phosphoenolpyruvate carboxykinase (GTP) [unclassified Thermococcus]NJE46982.1 phosphoenolpyruvate carboxykinase (GTP) [Thermococcus sp. GR7]NJE78966.1 phosphoenolpyruvate carboxykinase (GTP) [Thermococcus sp. GR4]NJF22690.1 phosphoenolpyruvate carboxykinase (GTP) [Thermococcus sp. GR5]
MNALERLEKLLDKEQFEKIKAIDNPELHKFLVEWIEWLEPSKVFVCTDNEEDEFYVRWKALYYGEEKILETPNHTVHYDNYYDQARDKANTKLLVPGGKKIPFLNTKDRDEGLKEIRELMKGVMRGKELFVCFFVLGPKNSVFTIPAVQLTDSAYVAHSEFILYRKGYEEFKRLGRSARFFKFVHSAGELDERKTSKNLDKRRIYIDLVDETVYSVNTQYGGNTIGLKKLAFRLTIQRAVREGWLSEHMFLMGVNGPKGRKTYFTGAYPSMCGKTSTAMISWENIVGDDLTFIVPMNGIARGANVEKGVFGIIQGVNPEDDPIIWQVLHSPVEIIFSNILVKDGKPYWNEMGVPIPDEGENHSGEWWRGKKDAEGNEIPPSHKNARFTVSLEHFPNVDLEALEAPCGVEVGGMIFGGRDKDTWPPVREAFDWKHGVITMGAALESETTAATLGKEGVRAFNPMAILDFMSVPLGEYIENYLEFEKKLRKAPKIFAVNYFLRDEDGNWLNHKLDKAVWLKWMELRVHGDVDAIDTPIGYIPKYEDLARLFREVLNKDYSREDYEKQFTIRVPELLAKIERIEKIYREQVKEAPEELFQVLEEERKRLLEAREKYGDYISPFQLEKT